MLKAFTYIDIFYGGHWNKDRKYFENENIILLGASKTAFQKKMVFLQFPLEQTVNT